MTLEEDRGGRVGGRRSAESALLLGGAAVAPALQARPAAACPSSSPCLVTHECDELEAFDGAVGRCPCRPRRAACPHRIAVGRAGGAHRAHAVDRDIDPATFELGDQTEPEAPRGPRPARGRAVARQLGDGRLGSETSLATRTDASSMGTRPRSPSTLVTAARPARAARATPVAARRPTMTRRSPAPTRTTGRGRRRASRGPTPSAGGRRTAGRPCGPSPPPRSARPPGRRPRAPGPPDPGAATGTAAAASTGTRRTGTTPS